MEQSVDELLVQQMDGLLERVERMEGELRTMAAIFRHIRENAVQRRMCSLEARVEAVKMAASVPQQPAQSPSNTRR